MLIVGFLRQPTLLKLLSNNDNLSVGWATAAAHIHKPSKLA